jgi:biotin carboxyl carrier protein
MTGAETFATEYEVRVEGALVEPAPSWRLEWVDRTAGIARLTDGTTTELLLVEGHETAWTVTIRGRRIGVTVRSRRERLLADAEGAATSATGPLDIRATLPGLVVAVAVSAGDAVAEGDPLLTIEAMKMQNEVRAPRSGTVTHVSATAGQAVAAGALLVRLG